MTELLEHVADEPIDADIRHQDVGPLSGDESLGLPAGQPSMQRAVVLTGRATGRSFVYAESAIAADRLPGSVRSRLETSRDPIGRVLLDHRIAVSREPLPGSIVAARADQAVGVLLADVVYTRRYRIVVAGTPAMVVSEWFFPTVPTAIAAHLGTRVATGG